MGITYDLHTRTHLNRLRRHYEAMRELEDDFQRQEEFELHAWAFARIFITSEYIRYLLHELLDCFMYDTNIWEREADTPDDRNLVRPIWALELAELTLRSARLMYDADPSHNTEFYGARDALDMMEKYMPFGAQTNRVFLAISEEDYFKWSGGYWNQYCWIGFPMFVKGL